MARITIQQGHCFRRTGATGTHREQEFASKVGPRLLAALTRRGHAVRLIEADDSVPAGDVFIALHTDGSTNPARRGASVGYPDSGGQQLARAWKRRHHQQGYPGGWLADNYTAALAGYYGFGQARGYQHRFLAEHGTTTNRADEAWLFANVDRVVQAHVDAIGDVAGHPNTTPSQEDDMAQVDQAVFDQLVKDTAETRNVLRWWIEPDTPGAEGPNSKGELTKRLRDLHALVAALHGRDAAAIAAAIPADLARQVADELADRLKGAAQ